MKQLCCTVRSGNSSYETGPTPSLISNGFIYRAIERLAPPLLEGVDYQAVCIYAKTTSDLMDKRSWTITEPLPFNKSWIPSNWEPKPEALGWKEIWSKDLMDKVYTRSTFQHQAICGKQSHNIEIEPSGEQFGLTFNRFPGGHTICNPWRCSDWVYVRCQTLKLSRTPQTNGTFCHYVRQKI